MAHLPLCLIRLVFLHAGAGACLRAPSFPVSSMQARTHFSSLARKVAHARIGCLHKRLTVYQYLWLTPPRPRPGFVLRCQGSRADRRLAVFLKLATLREASSGSAYLARIHLELQLRKMFGVWLAIRYVTLPASVVCEAVGAVLQEQQASLQRCTRAAASALLLLVERSELVGGSAALL